MTQFSLDFSGKLPVSAQLGRQQAEDNANEEWKQMFHACLVAVARRQEFLTSDDVLKEFETLYRQPSTHNASAIGAAMHRARRLKVIAGTNEVKRSARPEKHGNRQNVWRSLQWRSQ